MKKRIVAFMLGAMLAVGGVQVTQIPVKAETNVNGYQTADVLTTSASNNLDRSTSRWYKYTVPASGHFHFEVASSDGYTSLRLTVYDSKVHEIKSYGYSDKLNEFAFTPGTQLYLKIYNDGYSSAKYTLKTVFVNATDWENDYTNDEASGADSLHDGAPTYGVSLPGDDSDWYKFKMPSDGKVTFTLANTNSVDGAQWSADVYNDSMQNKSSVYIPYSDYTVTTDAIEEKAGKTVYVKIKRIWFNQNATYQVTPHFTAGKKSGSTVDTSTDTDIFSDKDKTSDTDAFSDKSKASDDSDAFSDKDSTSTDSDAFTDKDSTSTDSDTFSDKGKTSADSDSISDKGQTSADTDSTSDNTAIRTDTDDTSDSDNGSDVVTPPARVTGLKIKNLRGAKVKVTFNDLDDAAGYQIWYSYSGKLNKKFIYDTNSAKISVPKGRKVSVKVRAFNYDDNDERQFGKWSVMKIKKTDRR